jgi:hypothetical protein
MVTVQTYDELNNAWTEDSLTMSNDFDEISDLCTDCGIDITQIASDYVIWATLESSPTGKIHRFIITE